MKFLHTSIATHVKAADAAIQREHSWSTMLSALWSAYDMQVHAKMYHAHFGNWLEHCGRFQGRQSDVVCQILTVILYQLSVAHNFPFTLDLSAVATVMDLAVRYNASTCIDGDHERLQASADAAIVAVEAFDPVAAATRPTIHRLTHVPGSVECRGGAEEYDGGPYEHETPETRAAASSGNWRSEGLDMVLKTRVLEHLQIMASVPPERGASPLQGEMPAAACCHWL